MNEGKIIGAPAPTFPQIVPQVTPDGKILIVQVILAPGFSFQVALDETVLKQWMGARKQGAIAEQAIAHAVKHSRND